MPIDQQASAQIRPTKTIPNQTVRMRLAIPKQLHKSCPYLATIAIWAISVIAKLKYNGLVYGLDYGIYQPDGSHYTCRTLTFLGHSPIDAAKQTADWYSTHAFKRNIISPESLLPQTNAVWGLVSPRILYPILSIPFVALFGIPGMLTIPALSLLTLLLVTAYLFKSKPLIGLLLVTTLTASPTIMRWMMVNYTDALLTALSALIALLLTKFQQNTKHLLLLSTLIIATSATRICLPIWLAIALVLYINNAKKPALFTTTLSTIAALPALLLQPKIAIQPDLATQPLFTKILHLPISFIKIGAVESGQLIILDHALIAILALALYLAIKNYKEKHSQYFLTVLLAVWIIGTINGVLGVNFRYQLPLIPFALWVIQERFAHVER